MNHGAPHLLNQTESEHQQDGMAVSDALILVAVHGSNVPQTTASMVLRMHMVSAIAFPNLHADPYDSTAEQSTRHDGGVDNEEL